MHAPRLLVKVAALLNVAIFPLMGSEVTDTSKNAKTVTLRLLDEIGKPVAGADAGYYVRVRDFNPQTGGVWKFESACTTNAEGVAALRRQPGWQFVICRDADRGLVGIGRIKDAGPDGSLVIAMHPHCHVVLRITSSQLDKLGRKLEYPAAVFAFGPNQMSLGVFRATNGAVHAWLPPGTFTFSCQGGGAFGMEKSFAIKPGERQLDLGILDLPASRRVLLEGKPAPEIDDVWEWKNGPAVKLAELRGKVVLLEFWGWWCPPCVKQGIPEMMKLQEEFRGRDLAIIGVHTSVELDDDVTSVRKLDEKLADARKKFWSGKDITFPVAITRCRKESYYPGAPVTAISKTCVDYGVGFFPCTVLIDRKGRVAGLFSAKNKEDRSRLEKLLESH
jgi:thiol-disulfide isomerase/thioredoxin